ncbi:hypothetical protein BWI96_16580 [Siphonobacter sp. SORGH_AS_0500]|uniref:acyltransferase family protein n=1 Tax=Siphonobacter sp. SORGH_AS_0500 TaxID=1864824 RepID=UPI000CAB7F84|nr:hypothetical protein BWI96_16580 [Siphonobacter sp. SORGH_AS_0500]
MMKQRFTTLDIFRGILASFIVLFHMSFFSDTLVLNNPFMQGTDLFVDFFFILSGFIIRYNYSEIPNLQTLITFLKKRLLRIYPLHVILLLIYLFLELTKCFFSGSNLINNHFNTDNTITTFITNLFLLNSIPWSGITNVSWNNPSWSISAELLSYFLYAIVTYLILSNAKMRFKSAVYISIILLSFSILYRLTGSAIIVYTYNYGFLRGFIGFFTGVICLNTYSYLYRYFNKSSDYFFTYLEVSILIILGLTIPLKEKLADITVIYEALFFITILIFSFQKGFISHFLNKSRVLKNIGTYSYSIYLIHGLINTFFNVLFIRILRFAPSDYSYLFVLNYILVFYISRWTYTTIERRFYKPQTIYTL